MIRYKRRVYNVKIHEHPSQTKHRKFYPAPPLKSNEKLESWTFEKVRVGVTDNNQYVLIDAKKLEKGETVILATFTVEDWLRIPDDCFTATGNSAVPESKAKSYKDNLVLPIPVNA